MLEYIHPPRSRFTDAPSHRNRSLELSRARQDDLDSKAAFLGAIRKQPGFNKTLHFLARRQPGFIVSVWLKEVSAAACT